MAKAGQGAGIGGLEGIAAAVTGEKRKGPPPVERWNPPFCGDIDMRIAADGTWFYQKTPIGRPALVKLFASILKREGDKYFLVTPVEKVGLIVEEVPFLGVELKVEHDARGQVLNFRTNVDDWVAAGPGHALRFETEASGGLRPYLHVRRELWAKVTRALFYDLVELGEEREVRAQAVLLASGGAGQVYSDTTNPAVATGDGIAMAYRAGAELMDMEFYQFHPTAFSMEGAPRFLM